MEKRKFPCKIVIAPSHDLRAKVEVTVTSMEQVINAQRNRYEILEWK